MGNDQSRNKLAQQRRQQSVVVDDGSFLACEQRRRMSSSGTSLQCASEYLAESPKSSHPQRINHAHKYTGNKQQTFTPQQFSSSTAANRHQQRHYLSPANRCRRMSVAGGETALRREFDAVAAAAAEGACMYGGNVDVSGGASSAGGTPRRFSRPSQGGNNSRKSSCSASRSGGGAEENVSAVAAECSVAEHLKLTSYQMQTLQQSWSRIRSHGALSGVFRELIRRNDAVKTMFQKMSIVGSFSAAGKCCDQKEHTRLLIELIEFTLSNLNSPSKLVQQHCQLIGEQHFNVFGQRNESKIWDDFGDCISQAIEKAEPIRGKREAFRAWGLLITFVVESMRVGYVAMFKRKSLTRHSSSSQLVVQLATVEELQSLPTTRPPSAMNNEEKRSRTPI